MYMYIAYFLQIMVFKLIPEYIHAYTYMYIDKVIVIFNIITSIVKWNYYNSSLYSTCMSTCFFYKCIPLSLQVQQVQRPLVAWSSSAVCFLVRFILLIKCVLHVHIFPLSNIFISPFPSYSLFHSILSLPFFPFFPTPTNSINSTNYCNVCVV